MTPRLPATINNHCDYTFYDGNWGLDTGLDRSTEEGELSVVAVASVSHDVKTWHTLQSPSHS